MAMAGLFMKHMLLLPPEPYVLELTRCSYVLLALLASCDNDQSGSALENAPALTAAALRGEGKTSLNLAPTV